MKIKVKFMSSETIELEIDSIDLSVLNLKQKSKAMSKVVILFISRSICSVPYKIRSKKYISYA